jgi:hypothetical protein
LAQVSVARLEVNRVNLFDYFFSDQLKAEQVLIVHPQVSLVSAGNASGDDKKGGKNVLSSLPEKLASFAASVTVDYLTIQTLCFRYSSRSKDAVT